MPTSDPRSKIGPFVWRLAALLTIVAVIVTVLVLFRDELSLKALARYESDWRTYYREYPITALAIAFTAYVVVTGLSLPAATPMSIIYGKLFGFWPALVLVSFASTSGATVAFLLSRYLLGATIQARFGERLASFNAALAREGPFYLFTLRLIPQVPFFVTNVVMGLTPIRTRTFWWVSQLGMLPGTCVFIFAGASAPSLAEIDRLGIRSLLSPQLIVALTLLGVLPLAIRWTISAAAAR